MSQLATMNKIPNPLPPIPNILNPRKPENKFKTLKCLSQTTEETQEHSFKGTTTTRRVAIGLVASLALAATSGIGISLADDNGFWLTTPIPIPRVANKIANEETGTRSFIKNGIYIADIGVKGTKYRLRKTAFDLLALGDLLPRDAWNFVRKYLRLKSTFMYYDFDTIISASPVDDKQPLTDLANRLFDSFEKLEEAVKKHDMTQSEACYQNTTNILLEVRERVVYA